MSFILDALKKSESDRQQRSSPGIADVPAASRSAKTPRWMPALILLLLVNLAAVIYLALRPAETTVGETRPVAGPEAPETTVLASVPPQSRPAPQPLAQPTAEPQRPAERPRPAPVPATAAADSAPEPTPSSPLGFDRIVPEASGEIASQPVASPPPAAAEEESWLTLNDLRASGRNDLPEMHIDLHVYSEDPGDRFVFINMNQYQEDALLPEGPTVKQITTEGVLLEYRGTTFLLPRD